MLQLGAESQSFASCCNLTDHFLQIPQGRMAKTLPLSPPAMSRVLGSVMALTFVSVLAFSSGVLFAQYSSMTVAKMRTVSSDHAVSPTKSKDDDGWKTIDVFVGAQDLAQRSLDSTRKWYSQVNQDKIVVQLLGNKGYFIDLAANDATKLSNTYSLEQNGWKGLCMVSVLLSVVCCRIIVLPKKRQLKNYLFALYHSQEPNPQYWYGLTRFRSCQVVGAIVGQRHMEEIQFTYGGVLGGIVGFDQKKNSTATSPEYTVTLLEIFQRYQVPTLIDYLSLDVEGAEEFIMEHFPLEQYEMKVLTVERPSQKLRQRLESFGYQYVMDISRWGETLWVYPKHMPNVDYEALEKYRAKNKSKR